MGALGGRIFVRDEGKGQIVLTSLAVLAKEATATLRTAGFRFNKLQQQREGLARVKDAQHLANEHGGTTRQVATPPPTPAVMDTAAE
jgi:cellobiose phosphorylase